MYASDKVVQPGTEDWKEDLSIQCKCTNLPRDLGGRGFERVGNGGSEAAAAAETWCCLSCGRLFQIERIQPKEAESVPDRAGMVTILAPNSFYKGLTAGVQFIMGTGHTSDPHLIQWFSEHGYSIVRNNRRSNHSKRRGRRRK